MLFKQTATEQARHHRYVELLAEETAQPFDLVEAIYSEILCELAERSHVADFVPVFAWRQTRALLASR